MDDAKHTEDWKEFEDNLAKIFRDMTGEDFDFDIIEHYRWNMFFKARIFNKMIREGMNWRDALDKCIQGKEAKYVWGMIMNEEC